MLKSFQTIQTLQNIRSLNNEEDEQANKGVKLKIGEVNLNGAHVNNVIPPWPNQPIYDGQLHDPSCRNIHP